MFSQLIEGIHADWFVQSLSRFAREISVSTVVMSVLVVFMLVGLVDKLRGNRHGYGERFDAGFHAMGDLALAVVGIVSLSPVLTLLLQPIVTPICSLLGASPAMFPSMLLATDMGGYALSVQMAGEGQAAVGQYGGLIVASMMGITICFTIPYALRMVKKEDHPILARGILIGIATMPIGCFVGGALMALTSTPLSWSQLFFNTLPVLLLSLVVAAGLLLKPALLLRGFAAFGKAVSLVVAVSPAIAVFQYLTGLRLPLFYKMVVYDPVLDGVPLEKGLLLVGQIAIVLIGAFPLIRFLTLRLAKPMNALGQKTGIDPDSSSSLLTQLASSIPVWSVMERMNDRGKLINVAFSVSGSFVLGDMLAFVGGVNPGMVFPMIAAKLTAGLSALVLAASLASRRKAK